MESRRPIIGPSLVAAAGIALLFVQWRWERMLWLDEEMIAINIRDRTFAELAGTLSLGQAAPYGWLVLERALLLLFGPTERALRFFPFFFGAALLVVAVWVGRRWLTVTGATALVFLCAAGQWVSFYALELKHYSADTCFGLLLPALAVWAIERNRALTWWIVAAIAQWFSNGAVFVVPVCALMIVFRGEGPTDTVAPNGARGLSRARRALPGVLWLASFAANYIVTLGPARSSEFLRHYWANAFPPAGASPIGALAWVGAQLAPLAVKPIGSGLGVWCWLIAAAGFLLGTRPSSTFRLTFALVPLSAMVWAMVRLVPMSERLSLWMVPAMYVGIALAAEATADTIFPARLSTLRRAVGVAAALLLAWLFVDVARRGWTYLALAEPNSNHETDDRGAVHFLARQYQPGDVWVTTHNALPAIWWYAGPERDTPAFEAVVEPDPSACGSQELGEQLRRASASRVFVFLGFSHDVPRAFDDVLLARLGAMGHLTAYNLFGSDGHAVVFDLRQPPSGPVTLASLAARPPSIAPAATGCIAVSEARLW